MWEAIEAAQNRATITLSRVDMTKIMETEEENSFEVDNTSASYDDICSNFRCSIRTVKKTC